MSDKSGKSSDILDDESFKINVEYEYEDNDLQAILTSRLQQVLASQSSQKPIPIYVLGCVDDIVDGQLTQRLRQDIENYGRDGARIALIPCNLGNYHWVGILLEFQADGTIKRAEYIDSLGAGVGSVPQRLQTQLRAVYPGCDLYPRSLLKQKDGTSCGAYAIENLLQSALNLAHKETTSEEIRKLHLECLKEYRSDFYQKFYKRQKENQQTTISLTEQLEYHRKAGTVKFSKVEEIRLLDIIKCLKEISEVSLRDILLDVLHYKESYKDDVAAHLDAIRVVLQQVLNTIAKRSAVEQGSFKNLIKLLFGIEWQVGTELDFKKLEFRLGYEVIRAVTQSKVELGKISGVQDSLRQQIEADEAFARKLQAQLWRECPSKRDDSGRVVMQSPPVLGTPPRVVASRFDDPVFVKDTGTTSQVFIPQFSSIPSRGTLSANSSIGVPVLILAQDRDKKDFSVFSSAEFAAAKLEASEQTQVIQKRLDDKNKSLYEEYSRYTKLFQERHQTLTSFDERGKLIEEEKKCRESLKSLEAECVLIEEQLEQSREKLKSMYGSQLEDDSITGASLDLEVESFLTGSTIGKIQKAGEKALEISFMNLGISANELKCENIRRKQVSLQKSADEIKAKIEAQEQKKKAENAKKSVYECELKSLQDELAVLKAEEITKNAALKNKRDEEQKKRQILGALDTRLAEQLANLDEQLTKDLAALDAQYCQRCSALDSELQPKQAIRDAKLTQFGVDKVEDFIVPPVIWVGVRSVVLPIRELRSRLQRIRRPCANSTINYINEQIWAIIAAKENEYRMQRDAANQEYEQAATAIGVAKLKAKSDCEDQKKIRQDKLPEERQLIRDKYATDKKNLHQEIDLLAKVISSENQELLSIQGKIQSKEREIQGKQSLIQDSIQVIAALDKDIEFENDRLKLFEKGLEQANAELKELQDLILTGVAESKIAEHTPEAKPLEDITGKIEPIKKEMDALKRRRKELQSKITKVRQDLSMVEARLLPFLPQKELNKLPLMTAVFIGSKEMVEFLIEQQSLQSTLKLDIKDEHGWTVLHLAIAKYDGKDEKRREIIKLLLQAGGIEVLFTAKNSQDQKPYELSANQSIRQEILHMALEQIFLGKRSFSFYTGRQEDIDKKKTVVRNFAQALIILDSNKGREEYLRKVKNAVDSSGGDDEKGIEQRQKDWQSILDMVLLAACRRAVELGGLNETQRQQRDKEDLDYIKFLVDMGANIQAREQVAVAWGLTEDANDKSKDHIYKEHTLLFWAMVSRNQMNGDGLIKYLEGKGSKLKDDEEKTQVEVIKKSKISDVKDPELVRAAGLHKALELVKKYTAELTIIKQLGTDYHSGLLPALLTAIGEPKQLTEHMKKKYAENKTILQRCLESLIKKGQKEPLQDCMQILVMLGSNKERWEILEILKAEIAKYGNEIQQKQYWQIILDLALGAACRRAIDLSALNEDNLIKRENEDSAYIQTLLDNGANVNSCEGVARVWELPNDEGNGLRDEKRSPLIWAIVSRNPLPTLVLQLLKNSTYQGLSHENATGWRGINFLMCWREKNPQGYSEGIQYLRDVFSDKEKQGDLAYLKQAIQNGDVKALEQALDKHKLGEKELNRVDGVGVDGIGFSYLHYAALFWLVESKDVKQNDENRCAVMKLLIKRGADPNQRGENTKKNQWLEGGNSRYRPTALELLNDEQRKQLTMALEPTVSLPSIAMKP